MYGKPCSVVPPSSSRAMLGLIEAARIWRSRRNRRSTNSVSIPGRLPLDGHIYGVVLVIALAEIYVPMPPCPLSLTNRRAPRVSAPWHCVVLMEIDDTALTRPGRSPRALLIAFEERVNSLRSSLSSPHVRVPKPRFFGSDFDGLVEQVAHPAQASAVILPLCPDLAMQPSLRQPLFAPDGCHRDPQRLGRLLRADPPEKSAVR